MKLQGKGPNRNCASRPRLCSGAKSPGTDATDAGRESGTDDEGTRQLSTRLEELLRLQPDTLGAAKARIMDPMQVAICDLEAMETQQEAVCSATSAKHRT